MTDADQRRLLFKAQQRVEDANDAADAENGVDAGSETGGQGGETKDDQDSKVGHDLLFCPWCWLSPVFWDVAC